MEGFRKPEDTGQRRSVRVAVIKSNEDRTEQTCSCGAPFRHTRVKAREKAILKHIDKRHGGHALWL